MDFAEIGRWQDEGLNTVAVSSGSILDGVDAVTEPYQVSHHIGYLLHTAVDHLHTLTMVMGQAGAQHTFAPYTLIRAAIESASTALWILQAESPHEVARRSLQLEYADLNDLKRANQSVDPAAGHDEVRLEVFAHCLSRHGWKDPEIKPRPPGPLKIIQETSKHFDVFGAAVMWQMCSAAAHGRRWAREYLTLFEAQDDGRSKVLSGRLVSDESAIAMALHIACCIVRKAKTVQGAFSKNPLHSGTSFSRPAPELQIVRPGLYLPR
ncbi:hypothetical protein [Arthrobacter oryzae]|uniref:Uncharacterized protein n=1 Tax=Arthrobacter oryzae TaxID=409290 RepID=A0A3N0C3R8_9MICC|nr:hypothetical protein [Arthrobacter oryzae]RNL57285.1 hypothetical protein D7003_07210 [Arthrobacter oryzae]